jgi:hypothetical protein
MDKEHRAFTPREIDIVVNACIQELYEAADAGRLDLFERTLATLRRVTGERPLTSEPESRASD